MQIGIYQPDSGNDFLYLPTISWIQSTNYILDKNRGILGVGWTELKSFLPTKYWKCFCICFLREMKWFLWFAADVFFYIAERFFRRQIWEIAGDGWSGKHGNRLAKKTKDAV